MKREEFVKSQLEDFVKQHDPDASISMVDEIVLSYVVSILEDLGSQAASDDAFDVDDFVQMMDAYLPVFSTIQSINVSEWMFELANKLSNFEETDDDCDTRLDMCKPSENSPPETPTNQSNCEQELGEHDCNSSMQEATNSYCRQRTISSHSSHSLDSQGQERSRNSSLSENQGHTTRSRKSSSRQSSTSENQDLQCFGATANGEEEEVEEDEAISLLLEMFPASCSIEVSHCIALSNGDLERAAQLMLHRQETGDTITTKAARTKKTRSKKALPVSLNDSDMKKHIVDKYSYVDVDEDKKVHKPVLKAGGTKKMIRYLDGRVVSTRGERFTEIKKSEDEEKMKKTYVNLKPARQYRFH